MTPRPANRSETFARVAIGAGLLTVIGFFAPWVRSGTVDRSSIDLLVAAGSLELLDESARVVIGVIWGMVLVLVAGALLAATWHRYRLAGILLIPVGPVVAGAALIVRLESNEAFSMRWGAPIVALCALTSSVVAILLTMSSRATG